MSHLENHSCHYVIFSYIFWQSSVPFSYHSRVPFKRQKQKKNAIKSLKAEQGKKMVKENVWLKINVWEGLGVGNDIKWAIFETTSLLQINQLLNC